MCLAMSGWASEFLTSGRQEVFDKKMHATCKFDLN